MFSLKKRKRKKRIEGLPTGFIVMTLTSNVFKEPEPTRGLSQLKMITSLHLVSYQALSIICFAETSS